MTNNISEYIELIKQLFIEYSGNKLDNKNAQAKLSALFAYISILNIDGSVLNSQEKFEYSYMLEMYKEFMNGTLTPENAKLRILTLNKSLIAFQSLNEMTVNGLHNSHRFKVIEKKDLKKTVYVDMNVMSALIEQIDSKKTGDFQFVYSPEHIEDFVFSEIEYHIPSLKAISSITDDITVAYYEKGGFTFGREETLFVYKNRVLPDIDNIRRAKDMKAIDYSIDLEYKYSNPSKYNGSVPIEAPFSFITKYKNDINRVLSEIGALFTIDELINSKSEHLEYSDCNPIIHHLYHVMDIMGFQQDKISESKLSEATSLSHENYRKIRSSRLDIEHLLYGSCCDYFITMDKRLYFRASIIIRLLNRKCKVVLIKHQNEKSIYEEILNAITS